MEIGLHYYSFNVGDYRRDTMHLSLVEHGIYRQLLDSYYLNEGPITKSKDDLMRSLCVRNADEKEAFNRIVLEFFLEIDGTLIHRGCDKVIQQFHKKSDSARVSAKSRWEKNDANAMRTQCDGNATHNPIPITHNPIKTKQRSRALQCPQEVSLSVWEDFLAVRKAKRSPVTQTAIKSIEREAEKSGWSLEQALAECAARGWVGFKAEWVRTNAKDALNESRMQDNEIINRTMRRFKNADNGTNGPNLVEAAATLRRGVDEEMGGLGPNYADL
jgi:uncharacterized protein YdaU (DUF1376 family)